MQIFEFIIRLCPVFCHEHQFSDKGLINIFRWNMDGLQPCTESSDQRLPEEVRQRKGR